MVTLTFIVMIVILFAFLRYMVKEQKNDLALARAKKEKVKNLVR